MTTVVETTLTDLGRLTDLFASVKKQTITDVGHFTDVLTRSELSLLAITGHFTDALTSKDTTHPVLVDHLVGTDKLFERIRRDLAITGTFGTVLTDHRSSVLAITGHLTDVLTAKVTTHVTVNEHGTFSEKLLDSSGVDSNLVFATGTFGTTIAQFVRVRRDLALTGTFSDARTQFARVRAQLLLTGTFHDARQQTATVHAPVLADEMFGDAFVFSTPASAWSSSTDSWAMTRHEYVNMDSHASLEGRLFGATVSGVVAFAPSGLVTAWLESRLMDFGSAFLKAPSDMYVGYLSERPLTVTMTSTYSGDVEESFDYEMPERAAQTWVPGRVKLGRGLRSRYMRYRLANNDGGDFALDSVKFLMNDMTRQV